MNDWWNIEFAAHTDDMEERIQGIHGTMILKANDIFKALDLAFERLKTFGFEHVIINGGKRDETEGE